MFKTWSSRIYLVLGIWALGKYALGERQGAVYGGTDARPGYYSGGGGGGGGVGFFSGGGYGGGK